MSALIRKRTTITDLPNTTQPRSQNSLKKRRKVSLLQNTNDLQNLVTSKSIEQAKEKIIHGPVLYGQFVLETLVNNFPKEHLIGKVLRVYIPADYLTTESKSLKKRLLWGPNPYSPKSDVVAMTVHSNFFKPKKEFPEVIGIFSDIEFCKKDPNISNKLEMRNGIRPKYSHLQIPTLVRVIGCVHVTKFSQITHLITTQKHLENEITNKRKQYEERLQKELNNTPKQEQVQEQEQEQVQKQEEQEQKQKQELQQEQKQEIQQQEQGQEKNKQTKQSSNVSGNLKPENTDQQDVKIQTPTFNLSKDKTFQFTNLISKTNKHNFPDKFNFMFQNLNSTLKNSSLLFNLSNDPCINYQQDQFFESFFTEPLYSRFNSQVLYLETKTVRYKISKKNNGLMRVSKVSNPYLNDQIKLTKESNIPMKKTQNTIICDDLSWEQISFGKQFVTFNNFQINPVKAFFLNRMNFNEQY
ncbi:kruppel-like factor [Anaeramoeba flamelloides]|uniref:Kruppel-like factor n=1 Tax=Anaeramoeba flamelloides TaxID=1746091 RepID=A0AAV7Y7Y7_9EUKA|nr:kruppel-like factor [Anaeramoeba flamelloides]